MNKTAVAILGFTAGTAVGLAIGYVVGSKKTKKEMLDSMYVEPIMVDIPIANEKEEERPEPEKTQGDIPEFKPAKIASAPGEVGINYTKFVKDLKYKQETQVPPEDEPEDEDNYIPTDEDEDMDMTEYEETYEERLERESQEIADSAAEYKKAHAGKIELMTSEDWDTDFPETDYEREDLYYFTASDILTNEEGDHLDEEEYIGKKVRQVGWMQSPDEIICVRNHIKEKEYRIFKERCAVEDWF